MLKYLSKAQIYLMILPILHDICFVQLHNLNGYIKWCKSLYNTYLYLIYIFEKFQKVIKKILINKFYSN